MSSFQQLKTNNAAETPDVLVQSLQRKSLTDAAAQAAWAEKKWVWVIQENSGPGEAFLQATIISESQDSVKVQFDDGTIKELNLNLIEKMNPPKFDKVEDMAELSYLNESSVLHNLKQRYFSNLIYTYSGLFLVAVNPYKRLPIYTDQVVQLYRNKKRSEMPPHIFAVSDAAYLDMIQNHENQSLLITGESGAGKTENTKKVIQYLANIATDSRRTSSNGDSLGTLEKQIILANPILESFGNAQTIRNNNSSRFGKFIRIEFNNQGTISGGNIEKYLLEKSRVTHQAPDERSYHIFYQFLRGASAELKQQFVLNDDLNSYGFIKNSNKTIEGVDDVEEFKVLLDAMKVLSFTDEEMNSFFRIIAAILHLGNSSFKEDRDNQAILEDLSVPEKICHVLGIPVGDFTKGLLRPLIKAGRDWVTQARTVAQVTYSIEALSRSLYERMFSRLVERINQAIDKPSTRSTFIGVLDIAGFEIFKKNSFEQLCINYTNEKLQQFFNHHMFILEQEEYKREGIEWKFIDFGLDLQPTIDLIEKANPIGILSLLDEDCVMPKATDKTFTEKLHGIWKGKSNKYEAPRFASGFILSHYAGKVEYSTDGWLDKNKDPLNENITSLLANSSDKFVASLFSDYLNAGLNGSDDDNSSTRVKSVGKKGAFRTVSQKHKEQLMILMANLHSTQPHFVRCIIPNEEKKPGKISSHLVLDQLRCNGVLEGIRICRQGFPNRIAFAEFRQRYEILAPSGTIPKGFMDGRKAATILLEQQGLDKNQYRIGNTKVFFRAGVLAELEDIRDVKLSKIFSEFQAHARGYLARKQYKKKMGQDKAVRVIQRNARVYISLREWSWWKLYSKVKPLLNVTRVDEELKRKEESITNLELQLKKETKLRNELEDLKIQLEIDKRKIEEELESEKLVSFDTREILTRTQERLSILEEEIKSLSAEVETTENKYLNSKDELEKVNQNLQESLEKLSASQFLCEKLEKDLKLKETNIERLQVDLSMEKGRIEKLSEDKRTLEEKLNSLSTKLHEMEDVQIELNKQKSKLTSALCESEEKLAKVEQSLNEATSKNAQNELRLKEHAENITDLTSSIENLNNSLLKKEQNIRELTASLHDETEKRSALEKNFRDLNAVVNSKQQEIDNEKSEKEKLVRSLYKAENEILGLSKMIEEKGDESKQQAEIRKMRESELTNLKNQLASSQAELEEVRKKLTSQNDLLKSEVENLQSELLSITKLKLNADSSIQNYVVLLEEKEAEISKLEKSKKSLENQLKSTVEQLSAAEDKCLQLSNSKDSLEREVAAGHAKFEEEEMKNLKLEREKNGLQQQFAAAQAELEELNRKALALESQKKRFSEELNDAVSKSDEQELALADLNRKLASKSAEFDAYREKYSKESTEKVEYLDSEKKRLEQEVSRLSSALAAADFTVSNLEKTKARLVQDLEDSRLEVEKEHSLTRAAEKSVKAIETQLSAAYAQIESAKRASEHTELDMKKLQSQIDNLSLELEQKNTLMNSIVRSKETVEAELKNLISEIGEGGKNSHELEKSKKRLEVRLDELQKELEEEENRRKTAESEKLAANEAFLQFRLKIQKEMQEKEEQMEETRRLLMKEVNSLGETLDSELLLKSDLIKTKKKLEAELSSLNNSAEGSAKSVSDLEKRQRRAEAALREISTKLESEEKARRNFEDLSARHEKKSNILQSEVERLEGLLESEVKAKKVVENRNIELLHALEGDGNDSRASLLETRKKLSLEITKLEERLAEEIEAKALLEESFKKTKGGNENELRSQILNEFQDKLDKLEESRRALQAANRVTAGKLDEKEKELLSSEIQRKTLSNDYEELKQRLEAELGSKADEASAKRKLQNEIKELSIKLDAEISKSDELADSLYIYKTKADSANAKVDAIESTKAKSERNEALLKARVNELEELLSQSKVAGVDYETRYKDSLNEMENLRRKVDDYQIEVSELLVSKKKLKDSLDNDREKLLKEASEKDATLDLLKKKFTREVSQLASELEAEKASSLVWRENCKNLEAKVESLVLSLESEARQQAGWKKDKERLETKVTDLNNQYNDALSRLDALQKQVLTTGNTNREIRVALEDAEAKALSLEKSKKNLEAHINEVLEQNLSLEQIKQANERQLHGMEGKLTELQSEIAQKEEFLNITNERLRKLESQVSSVMSDLTKEKNANMELLKEKSLLERQNKDLHIQNLAYEANNGGSNDFSRLSEQVTSLTQQLENESKEKLDAIKDVRKFERQVKELQVLLADKERHLAKIEEDLNKAEDKFKKCKTTCDEMEQNIANSEIQKRKLERDVSELSETISHLQNLK